MPQEQRRLAEAKENGVAWKKWGPYLSERAWGTVREDYSADGLAWQYLPHDWARSKAYRWNEDGILGICDDSQLLCFALALWNGKDAILKERFFGLTGPEGNHGEDVKELYYYLDSTPTHSYMKGLYKYPQAMFPYERLVAENRRRTRTEPEFELFATGVFAGGRYFDVCVEYAKADADDILIRISARNNGLAEATLHLLPTIWFRNRWSWTPTDAKPTLKRADNVAGAVVIAAHDRELGTRWLVGDADGAEVLFTENETNLKKLYGVANASGYAKDGINDYVVNGAAGAVNPAGIGTKAAIRYAMTIPAGATKTIRLRLRDRVPTAESLGAEFDAIFTARQREADEFYEKLAPPDTPPDPRNVQRQALAGLLWSKQFYHYNVRRWLTGDPGQPQPPDQRWAGRNHDWQHLSNRDVISMPDKWEYPWYASWDLAFHCVTLATVDAEFAKGQLILLLREWYMHPSGQLPAYEWSLGDANPPVQAWAALRVYRIDRKNTGTGDHDFLRKVFQKLLINFTWWVNRKDQDGRNLFQGGFLGLDNIGLFDRDAVLPDGRYLDQCDGTAWMAMYCLNMLALALELAAEDATCEDIAVKFLEHFFYVAHAMNDRPATRGDDGVDLWDDEDGFYYDVLRAPDGTQVPLRVRSVVGLIPLLAVETIDARLLDKLPVFKQRLEWFLQNRPDLCGSAASVTKTGAGQRRLFSLVNEGRLRRLLTRMLDEREFLSEHGLRSLSKEYANQPYRQSIGGTEYVIDYEPAESTTPLFGGNSNWRGPVWFPLNYLMIEALQKLDYYYGDGFKVECPTGSSQQMTLWDVGAELSRRLTGIFTRNAAGIRPVFGGNQTFQTDERFRDLILFHEYFHGDNGAGLGASHQTGWTALVAKLIQQRRTKSRAGRA